MQFSDEQLQLVIDRLEEADKFMTNFEADPMRQMQTNVLFQLGLKDEALMKLGFAALNRQLALMQKDMLNIINSFSAGRIGFNDAVKQWRTMSGSHYKELFKAGGMAVGNPFYDKLGLTRPDVAYINRVRRFEERFFKKFLNDIKDPKHLPARKIPRDARGRPLKGYRRQQFSYSNRAKMYANSAKTVFFGGQIAGSGPNTRIFWMLGPAERHCGTCPVYATNRGGRGYTWATLPTTPLAGDTECQMACLCRLEYRQVTGKAFQTPGLGSADAMLSGGRYGRMFDARGTRVGGAAQAEVESVIAQMNKARQMIELSAGEAKLAWIAQRRELNKLLIDMQGKGRIVPTISVKELMAATKDALVGGGSLVDDFARLLAGDEVALLRSNYFQNGLLRMEGNRLVFIDANGVKLFIDDASDIVFALQRKWTPSGTLTQAEKWSSGSAFKDTVYHGTSSTSIKQIESGGFSFDTRHEGVGLWGKGFYFTPSKMLASQHASGSKGIMSVKLNIQNSATASEMTEFIAKANAQLKAVGKPDLFEALKLATKFAKDAGYDSVLITGHEILVFDAKNIMVIK